jgi:hypothetical protein
MGISIVIFFFTYSGLKLTKLNILGNEFDLPNSYIVNISLWVIFVYWFMRYFQYLPPTSIYRTYESALFQLIRPQAEKEFESMADSFEIRKPPNTRNTRPKLNQTQWQSMPPGWNPFSAKHISIHYDVDIILSDDRKVPQSTTAFEVTLSQTKLESLKYWWTAVNYTIWRTPFVTEYVIPPLLAAIAASASIGFYVVRLIHERVIG